MESIISKLERIITPVAEKISGGKYLFAMRDSFSMLLPFIIVGLFFGIIEWVVIDPQGTIMGGLLQIVWLLIDIAIYAPFVIAANKIPDEEDSN